MAMSRIYCPFCGWTTNPHYSILDCVKEKEWDHEWGLREGEYNAHDSAFGTMCPKCGKQVREQTKYFTTEEIEKVKQKRGANG